MGTLVQLFSPLQMATAESLGTAVEGGVWGGHTATALGQLEGALLSAGLENTPILEDLAAYRLFPAEGDEKEQIAVRSRLAAMIRGERERIEPLLPRLRAMLVGPDRFGPVRTTYPLPVQLLLAHLKGRDPKGSPAVSLLELPVPPHLSTCKPPLIIRCDEGSEPNVVTPIKRARFGTAEWRNEIDALLIDMREKDEGRPPTPSAVLERMLLSHFSDHAIGTFKNVIFHGHPDEKPHVSSPRLARQLGITSKAAIQTVQGWEKWWLKKAEQYEWKNKLYDVKGPYPDISWAINFAENTSWPLLNLHTWLKELVVDESPELLTFLICFEAVIDLPRLEGNRKSAKQTRPSAGDVLKENPALGADPKTIRRHLKRWLDFARRVNAPIRPKKSRKGVFSRGRAFDDSEQRCMHLMNDAKTKGWTPMELYTALVSEDLGDYAKMLKNMALGCGCDDAERLSPAKLEIDSVTVGRVHGRHNRMEVRILALGWEVKSASDDYLIRSDAQRRGREESDLFAKASKENWSWGRFASSLFAIDPNAAEVLTLRYFWEQQPETDRPIPSRVFKEQMSGAKIERYRFFNLWNKCEKYLEKLSAANEKEVSDWLKERDLFGQNLSWVRFAYQFGGINPEAAEVLTLRHLWEQETPAKKSAPTQVYRANVQNFGMKYRRFFYYWQKSEMWLRRLVPGDEREIAGWLGDREIQRQEKERGFSWITLERVVAATPLLREVMLLRYDWEESNPELRKTPEVVFQREFSSDDMVPEHLQTLWDKAGFWLKSFGRGDENEVLRWVLISELFDEAVEGELTWMEFADRLVLIDSDATQIFILRYRAEKTATRKGTDLPSAGNAYHDSSFRRGGMPQLRFTRIWDQCGRWLAKLKTGNEEEAKNWLREMSVYEKSKKTGFSWVTVAEIAGGTPGLAKVLLLRYEWELKGDDEQQEPEKVILNLAQETSLPLGELRRLWTHSGAWILRFLSENLVHMNHWIAIQSLLRETAARDWNWVTFAEQLSRIDPLTADIMFLRYRCQASGRLNPWKETLIDARRVYESSELPATGVEFDLFYRLWKKVAVWLKELPEGDKQEVSKQLIHQTFRKALKEERSWMQFADEVSYIDPEAAEVLLIRYLWESGESQPRPAAEQVYKESLLEGGGITFEHFLTLWNAAEGWLKAFPDETSRNVGLWMRGAAHLPAEDPEKEEEHSLINGSRWENVLREDQYEESDEARFVSLEEAKGELGEEDPPEDPFERGVAYLKSLLGG